ncbi:MAG: dTMP kinase [Eubacterium sp.]|nr:dTMP kinase [Eubacterium sp.]MDD7209965.1 dTMP kinase [Lachnospiraceae bacterium]MDY5497868.1 dTMP kinase [Anaerobutyricum sp.]
MRGLFLVMEGPDGSGKTTQINLLKEYLSQNGYECMITREPGGTEIGEKIRKIILNPQYKEMSPVTEMLLYAASRAQLISEVIGPALEEGKIVLSDRFVDSSIVYQGIGRNLGISTVTAVNAPGIGIYRPDGIFFIDISEEEGIKRKKEQKKLDRMEQESIDFHHMVSEGYRKVLSGRSDVMKIDGSQSIEVIHKKIRNQVNVLLENRWKK